MVVVLLDRIMKIINEYNWPFCEQSGLWCQWTLTEDKVGIEWDGNEKFYEYKCIVEKVLTPRGYVLNGVVAR
jgi:hypothetical protein